MVVAGAMLTVGVRGVAQQSGPPPVPLPDGAPVVERRGFSLFSAEDLAGASLKLAGGYRYAAFNAGGLCSFANTNGDLFNSGCGVFNGASNFFHYQVAWGVPPSAYERIKALWPAVAQMRPPLGYSTPWRTSSIAPMVLRIGPSDGQVGSLFSGAAAADGAGCRDMSGIQGANLPKGLTLTALSDCPETWGPAGFQGLRTIPDSVWLQRFHQNPVAFRWEDWKVLPGIGATTPVLGDLSTYGAFSDYNSELLAQYGMITPKGAALQPPLWSGFPLGIEVRYDAFKFDRKSLRDGVFVRWLVVNNSASVWGSGVNYDSLYMGVDPGYIPSQPTIYNVPALGVHLRSYGGLSGRCSVTYPRRKLPAANEACGGTSSGARMHVTLVLKSPIGDLRNKLFSNPASPFYAPAHPKADDTITFNHWRRGGFGLQDVFSWRRSDRSLFGLMSGREDLWLDGRAFSAFSAVQIWTLFRYEFTDGTQSAANVRYNRSAPGGIAGYGKWDYNDDGAQDTLFLPDCGVQGCSKLWSDTIAGGYAATTGGNVGNYLGVGPFSLNAGDTTEFFWYLGGANDTVSFNRLVQNVTGAYLANFSTVLAPPQPAFTASDVQLTAVSATDTTRTSQVRIQIRMPARQNDAYLSRVVMSRLESADPTAVELRRLNPGIVQAVQGRMQQNLARLLVFKSCDAGRSWTDATGKCDSAATARTQTVSGATAGLGWQAFRTIAADTVTGNLSTHVVADAVPPGHEYLYSFVTQSRSLADISVVYQETLDASGTVTSHKIGTLWDALAVDVDTATSQLATTGPTTVRVYAPVSIPAATFVARVDTATRQGAATNRVTAIARSAHAAGTYRMRFGNRFILTRAVDTLTSARVTTLVRQSVYARAANPGDAFFTTNLVASADTFVSSHDLTYSSPAATALRVTPRTTMGTVLTFVDTISAAGYVVARMSGANDALYLAVGPTFPANTPNSFTASALTQIVDPYEGTRDYPGFTATVTAETAPPAARSIGSHAAPVIRAPGDTLVDSIAATGVRYVSFTSGGPRSSPGGLYRVQWQGDAFGPNAPFTFGMAAQMQPVLDGSLAARPVATFGDTSGGYRVTIRAATGTGEGTSGVGTRQLVRAKVPFTVMGLNGQPAKIVMLTRHSPGNAVDSVFRNSRLFGTAGDTTRLAIPPDVWMPGDTVWVFENLVVDSTVAIAGQLVQIVHDTTVNGRVQRLPIQVTRELMGIKLALQCTSNTTPTRVTCNPIAPGPRGATKYLPFQAGWEQLLHFNRPFDQNSEVALTATPTQATARPLTKADMDKIRVVPNPYIVQSSFDQPGAGGNTTARILFVNVPNEGMLRIYTVSGQMVQQLSWTAADLIAPGDNSPHGDLPYNLRTREGRDLAGGLYLYVLTPRGANANRTVARGKFVVIR